MGKGLSILVWFVALVIISVTYVAGAATVAWRPSPFAEYKVFQSRDAWAPTPALACDAFRPEAEALWVGRTNHYGGGIASVVVRIGMEYAAPQPGTLSPPGECRVLKYVSYNGATASLDGYQSYAFGRRGRFFIAFEPLPVQLGHSPVRKNSHERRNAFVGEPLDVVTGNIYHSEGLAVGNGRRAIRFRRYYNSQSKDSGVIGANRSMSFGQSIQVTLPPQPDYPPPSSYFTSGLYDTPDVACSDGWDEIKATIKDSWAAASHARIDAQDGRCVIYVGDANRVYGFVPVSSSLTTQAYYPGAAPLPAVVMIRPDGTRYTLRQIDGVWADGTGIAARLEEVADGNGERTGWRYTTQEKTVETYDANGRLLSVRAIDGLTATLRYDGSGRLVAVQNDAGYALTFGYDTQGRIATMTDHSGRVWSYDYDINGNLARVQRPDGTSRRYRYGDARFPHALTDIVDGRGIDYIHYAYDERGRAVLSTLAGDAGRVDIAYDDVDGTRIVTDGTGAASTYTVTIQNDVPLITAVEGPACPTCGNGHYSASFDMDTNELLSETHDGVTTAYGDYDAKGNPGYHIEGAGTVHARRTVYTYDPRFLTRVTSKTTASVAAGRNRVVRYQYDDHGNLIQKTVSGYTPAGIAVSRTTTYAYDGPYHQLSRIDGPRTDVSDVTTYTYDTQGNLVEVTDALGHVTDIDKHDALGRPLTLTGPNGLVTQLAYDTLGRLVSRSAGGETTSFSYDAAGDLVRITLPDGSYLAYSYDDARRLTGVMDRQGNRIVYTLDKLGNRVQEDRFDPDNNLRQTRSRAYNDLSQLVRTIGAQGQITAYRYDTRGNRSAKTDPLGHVTTHAFDALNRLMRTTDALGGTAVYDYDNQDHLVGVTDPDSHAITYTYDDLGNRLMVDSPDSGITRYGYDAAGNIVTRTDAKGNMSRYTYDALNRLTGVTYADGAIASYSYDSSPNGIGRLTGVSNAEGRTSWAYDLHGRIIEKRQTVGDLTLKTRYRYDSYGRRVEMVYPSGAMVDFGYDANGRITTVSVNGSHLISGIRYQPFGSVTGWTWGNGTPYDRQYDLDGRLASFSLPSGARAASYDAADRLIELADSHVTLTLGYDAVDRLTQVVGGSVKQVFDYDPNGNRIGRTRGASVTTYSYLAGTNRLSGQSGTSAKAYTYDANGSVVGDGVNTYTYDARNRLVEVDGTATYVINPLGRRLRKAVNMAEPPGDANGDTVVDRADFDLVLDVILGHTAAQGNADCNRDNQLNVQDLVCLNTTIVNGVPHDAIDRTFFYDGKGELIGEYGGGGAALEETVYLHQLPIATIQSDTVYYIYANQLGAPQAITDNSNVPLWRWKGTPFGDTAPEEDPDGNGTGFIYNLRFPGQYYDREDDLVYNYARMYDPAVGRYIESDPIGIGGGLNPYVYVRNAPVRYSDRYGLKGCGSGWNEPLVPDNPLGYPFVACCNDHDNCYGSCLNRIPKSGCDGNFHSCMLKSCNHHTGASHWICKELADTYYDAVHRLGQSAFNAARKRCSDCGKDR